MSLRNLEFSIKETAANIRRHGLMTVAAVSTVAVSLCVLGVLMLTLANLNSLAEQVAGRMGVEAYFSRSLSAEATEALLQEIETVPNVKEVRFVPRDEALERLKVGLEDQLDLSDLEKNNPLEDSAEIDLIDPEQIAATAENVEALEGVEKVMYGRAIAQRLLQIRRMIRVCGVVAVALMGLAALMIVHNTIRLTVFARRREIHIMQLVGATDWFIRAPFLLEGIFHGVAGAVLTTVVLVLGYSYLVKTLAVSMPFLSLVSDVSFMSSFAAAVLGAGLVFGVTGSVTSVRRFLNSV